MNSIITRDVPEEVVIDDDAEKKEDVMALHKIASAESVISETTATSSEELTPTAAAAAKGPTKWDLKTQTPHGGQEWSEISNLVEDFSVTTNGLGPVPEALEAAKEATMLQPATIDRLRPLAAAEGHESSEESILPTKMPQPPTGGDYHGHDLLDPLQMLYHLYHQGMGGVHHEMTDFMSGALGDVGDITDIMPGDFFDTRKTAKFGIYSGDFNLDEYGSVATDVTVYAKTKEYNVNKDDFRYLSVDVHGGSFGHWFGYNPTVKMYNGVGNVYISAYYFRPLPVEPYMASGNHSMDEATTTTPKPEQYDHGHDEDYYHVTLTAKARATIYLPWGQTAVPCFGSAGGDGA
ncbi:dual specificity protein kinase yak1, partial [Perkinsus olseni]